MANESKSPAVSFSTAYHIKVSIDSSGAFHYTAAGHDASTIQPSNGDTVSWSVKLNGKRVPFQIEFHRYSPFGFDKRVIRSAGQETSPLTVNMPDGYAGDLVLKYTVSLGNAWSDDPDVEPVLSDGIDPRAAANSILLSLDGSGHLLIEDPDESFTASVVTWKWAGAAPDSFTLKFINPPAGWPAGPQGPGTRIALPMRTPGSADYTIETTSLGVQASGSLTITP